MGFKGAFIAWTCLLDDIYRDRIERADFNGGNREIVVQTTVHPFSVAVFRNHVYWTDWILRKLFFRTVNLEIFA